MAFVPFSPAHWAGIAFAAAVMVGIIGFRSMLRAPRADSLARWSLAIFLAACDLSLYVSYTLTNDWGTQSLPLQLCTMTLWLSVVLLLTRNRKLYDVAFLLGVLGAVQALATPNLDFTFPHYRYFEFFIAHALIIGAGVYMTAVAGYRPNFRSVLRAWGWLNVLALPAGVANKLTGENFMFLARKPDTASLLDLLAPWPWYLLQLEVIAFSLCFLLFSIILLSDRMFGQNSRQKRTGNQLPL